MPVLPEHNFIDEKNLLQQVSEGNEQAFRQLFDTYKNKIYFYILKITESEDVAEDVVQNIFLKLWINRANLIQIQNLNAYLYRMSHNYAINGLKRMARETLALAEINKQEAKSYNSADENVIHKDVQQLLNKAIEQLPTQQKLVFKMSWNEGLKQEEIAQRLNISILTVKKHKGEALRKIRENIHKSYGLYCLIFYVTLSFSITLF
ncbi:MAG: RNA polymerase sigma-70 factor [Ginsengibacter sp.]